MDKSTYYTVAHPKEFAINWREFYDEADRLTVEVKSRLRHRLDINYSMSNDPKQKLDLYFPDAGSERCPVFIFLHGGGFREGDKEDYGYVAVPFSAYGVITVVANYRLAPQHTYPAQVEDVQEILSWIHHNIERLGGDSENIYIGGHSAGAILSATVSMDSSWTRKRKLPANLVKGCVPISGRYDLRDSPSTEVYVSDPSLLVEASPVLNVVDPPARSLVVAGSKEESVLRPSEDLVAKIKQSGREAKLVILEDMNHADTALTLRNAEGRLFKEIIELFAKVTSG